MPTHEDIDIVGRCIARFQRVSARKARLVANLVRGKRVGDALRIAKFANRPSAAPMVLNALKSAVAGVDRARFADPEKELVVGEIKVDDGPIMYRFRPASRGRGVRIRRRFCHIAVKLVQG